MIILLKIICIVLSMLILIFSIFWYKSEQKIEPLTVGIGAIIILIGFTIDIMKSSNDTQSITNINSNNVTNIFIGNDVSNLIDRTKLENSITPIIVDTRKIYIDKLGVKIKDDGTASINLDNCLFTEAINNYSLSFSRIINDRIKVFDCKSIGRHQTPIYLFYNEYLVLESKVEIEIVDQDDICGFHQNE
ncbi:MAG: hypothetical protein IPO16_02645 [Saprospiraceae bacterium]|nr:hypothetical protein [Saprospiraceae bacterium]